ncbi:MAG: EamA family transporter, partial [Dehalococcoidia bacterium]
AVWLRSASDGFDAAAAGAIRFPLATALLLLAAFSQPHSSFRRRPLTRRTLGVLALSGILTQGLAGLLFIVALGDIGAGKTVVLFSTAPLLALPLGAIFLKERITIWVAIGTVIVVGGVVLMA